MCEQGCACNLAAKVNTGIGCVVVAIGLIIYIIGLVTAQSIVDDRILVDGQRNFQLSADSWSLTFMTQTGTNCQDHVDSLDIVHSDTNEVETLSFTCWMSSGTAMVHGGVNLKTIGEFYPEKEYGTYQVSSGYNTWVLDNMVTSDQFGAFMGGALMGMIGFVTMLVGSIFWCVACCCCCQAGQQAAAAAATAPVGGPSPTYYGQQPYGQQPPPTYQGGVSNQGQVVVVGQPLQAQGQCVA
ncbi:Dhcr24 [Symbiodinium natans]|uniref:Dhcr24 protein n=1 Tax=Symbiodinium natans TaxID=878477 RepID=A0A812NYU9_9DINO|nr:Dhcr24 [Symbiodinium natans]